MLPVRALGAARTCWLRMSSPFHFLEILGVPLLPTCWWGANGRWWLLVAGGGSRRAEDDLVEEAGELSPEEEKEEPEKRKSTAAHQKMSRYIVQDSDSTFTVTFNGRENIFTTLTASGNEADLWISDILRLRNEYHLIVGIDVEWRPSRSRMQNPTALLQICVDHRCLLFQLLHADYIPHSLKEFLSNPRFTFVGVGINEDIERLVEDSGLMVQNAVDLRELAVQMTGRLEMRQMGLKTLAEEIVGVQVSKPNSVKMSRWDQEVLTLDQIMYACLDAFLSFEIGRRLYAGGSFLGSG
ncbi:hypothetical protein KSP39_PZI015176 [Platanthera zijinensis]|uniref:3'-5' exonuclease domain-containing protein n=1 Tax=Platanthera zijinensis TaxID=2320716 RepID=A0AAP0BB47_9ASPA